MIWDVTLVMTNSLYLFGCNFLLFSLSEMHTSLWQKITSLQLKWPKKNDPYCFLTFCLQLRYSFEMQGTQKREMGSIVWLSKSWPLETDTKAHGEKTELERSQLSNVKIICGIMLWFTTHWEYQQLQAEHIQKCLYVSQSGRIGMKSTINETVFQKAEEENMKKPTRSWSQKADGDQDGVKQEAIHVLHPFSPLWHWHFRCLGVVIGSCDDVGSVGLGGEVGGDVGGAGGRPEGRW